jgi:mRNA interferase HicA
VKRRDLERLIRRRASARGLSVSYREGGKHTIVWVGSRTSAIPRHTEINEYTVEGILEELDLEVD